MERANLFFPWTVPRWGGKEKKSLDAHYLGGNKARGSKEEKVLFLFRARPLAVLPPPSLPAALLFGRRETLLFARGAAVRGSWRRPSLGQGSSERPRRRRHRRAHAERRLLASSIITTPAPRLRPAPEPSRRPNPRRWSRRSSPEAASSRKRAAELTARRNRPSLRPLPLSSRRAHRRRRQRRRIGNASAARPLRRPHAPRARPGSPRPDSTTSTCLPGSARRSGERCCRSTRPLCWW